MWFLQFLLSRPGLHFSSSWVWTRPLSCLGQWDDRKTQAETGTWSLPCGKSKLAGWKMGDTWSRNKLSQLRPPSQAKQSPQHCTRGGCHRRPSHPAARPPEPVGQCTESWEITNVCSFKPLGFGMECYATQVNWYSNHLFCFLFPLKYSI